MTKAERSAWGLAVLLLVANTFSFIDRTLLTLLVAPIRAELGVSDTVISLLHGLSFAALYAVMGLPLGRWADRGDRPRLMASGVALWSGMTAASGAAGSVLTLAVARAGVAIGEAALAPAAVSLLAERLPRHRVARGIAVFQSGIFLGSAAALAVGGGVLRWLEHADRSGLGPFATMSPWRVVFWMVGTPGLLVALALWFVREPRRDGNREGHRAADRTAPSPLPLRALLAALQTHRAAYVAHLVAFTAITMLAYGVMAWMPTVLVRRHGIPTASAGLWLGSLLLVAGPLGVVASGALVDAGLAREDGEAPLRAARQGALLLGASVVAYALAPSLGLALACFVPLAFALGFPYGIASGALALITPAPLRGQVTALYLLISNLLGLSLGPLLVALATDHLFHRDSAVHLSLALLPMLLVPIAVGALTRGAAPFAAAWRSDRA
jgi:MFS family permease